MPETASTRHMVSIAIKNVRDGHSCSSTQVKVNHTFGRQIIGERSEEGLGEGLGCKQEVFYSRMPSVKRHRCFDMICAKSES